MTVICLHRREAIPSVPVLGYHIKVQHCDAKITKGQRGINGKIALQVPPDVIRAQCARYREHGKPWHRPRLQNLDDYDIVRIYGAEYRGVVNYHRRDWRPEPRTSQANKIMLPSNRPCETTWNNRRPVGEGTEHLRLPRVGSNTLPFTAGDPYDRDLSPLAAR